MAEHPIYAAFRAEAKRLGYTVRRARGRRLPYIHINTMASLIAFIRATTLDLRWYNAEAAGYDVYPPGGDD